MMVGMNFVGKSLMIYSESQRKMETPKNSKLPLDEFRAVYQEQIKELYDAFLMENPENVDTADQLEEFTKTEHKIYLSDPEHYPWQLINEKTIEQLSFCLIPISSTTELMAILLGSQQPTEKQ